MLDDIAGSAQIPRCLRQAFSTLQIELFQVRHMKQLRYWDAESATNTFTVD